MIFLFLIFKNIFFIYSWEIHREAQTQAEGEAGSTQGARCGTWSWVSRITPKGEGRHQTAEPPRDPCCWLWTWRGHVPRNVGSFWKLSVIYLLSWEVIVPRSKILSLNGQYVISVKGDRSMKAKLVLVNMGCLPSLMSWTVFRWALPTYLKICCISFQLLY